MTDNRMSIRSEIARIAGDNGLTDATALIVLCDLLDTSLLTDGHRHVIIEAFTDTVEGEQ